jgi:hypothetical protein
MSFIRGSLLDFKYYMKIYLLVQRYDINIHNFKQVALLLPTVTPKADMKLNELKPASDYNDLEESATLYL